MSDSAIKLIPTIDDAHLPLFAQRLADWLVADLNQSDEPVPDFTDSRAKALVRATGMMDDPTRHSFDRLVETDVSVRVALYDLLGDSGLAENDEVQAIAATAAAAAPVAQPIPFLLLAIAAYAWKRDYPLYQLDPASPPSEHSPAGQIVRRAASFMRQQVQRGATERDKLGRKLAFAGLAGTGTPSLDALSPSAPIAAAPPHYRVPVPVSYPETLRIEPEQTAVSTPFIPRQDPIIIEAMEPQAQVQPTGGVTRMPAIQIGLDDLAVEPPAVTPPVVQPTPTPPRPRTPKRKRPLNTTTKLRIIVQEYPDGPGMYGLQVSVASKSVKKHLAGITNRDGKLLCELPINKKEGVTYDVDVTWPRDLGGETERKSITLHADRTEFVLPFYIKSKQ